MIQYRIQYEGHYDIRKFYVVQSKHWPENKWKSQKRFYTYTEACSHIGRQIAEFPQWCFTELQSDVNSAGGFVSKWNEINSPSSK